jgi:short-subunit dehydrogenase
MGVRKKEPTMFTYRDSTAMITGASKGLGAAFAKELAGRGMNLVLVARSIDTLQDLADSLGAQYGVRCVVLQADLATSDAVKRIVTELGPGSEDRSADQ